MDSHFYKSARKWYNTIYVNPASERIVYFLIFIISLCCLYFSFEAIKVIIALKGQKNTYVLYTNGKTDDTYINIKPITCNKDQILALLETIITKYVLNMETLKYEKNQTGLDAIRDKSIIIKNLSGKEVYDKYMSNAYKDTDGDMSLSILKLQKTAVINKIEFIYENMNVFEKMYSALLVTNIPKGAKVYFSTETTDEKQKKQHLIATMSFNFYIEDDRRANSTIDFKVNDYYIEEDKSISNVNNDKA